MYIGFTNNFETRMKAHIRDIKNYSKRKFFKCLYSAIEKYGWNNFEVEIIYQSKELNHTKNVMERYFIEEYKTYINEVNSCGYNMTLGGDGSHGRKCKEYTKQKIKESQFKPDMFTVKDKSTGKIIDRVNKNDEKYLSGEYVSVALGFNHSEKTRKLMSEKKKGINPYKRTEQTNKNISEGRKGKCLGENNAMAKEENRKKVGESKIGRKKYINPETKDGKYCFPGKEPEGYILSTLLNH